MKVQDGRCPSLVGKRCDIEREQWINGGNDDMKARNNRGQQLRMTN